MLQLIDGKFDITAFLAQFNTEELEAFKIEVEADIKRRKTDDEKVREVALLQALNERKLSQDMT